MLELVIAELVAVVNKLREAVENDGRISANEWGDILGDLLQVAGVIAQHLREQRKARRAARG